MSTPSESKPAPDDGFGRALTRLGISDYREAIWNSNSHGELYHLLDYITIASMYKGTPEAFREWFEKLVQHAEQHWERPQSIYQHILYIILEAKNHEPR